MQMQFVPRLAFQPRLALWKDACDSIPNIGFETGASGLTASFASVRWSLNLLRLSYSA